VRATENRKLTNPKGNLIKAIAALEPVEYFTVDIKQKGGRKAQVTLSYREIVIKKPQYSQGGKEICLNINVCQEIGDAEEKEKLCWILCTSEFVTSAEEARKIVRYYELRWRIEEFHKTWKSDGTEVEKLRMQSRENLKRIAVI